MWFYDVMRITCFAFEPGNNCLTKILRSPKDFKYLLYFYIFNIKILEFLIYIVL